MLGAQSGLCNRLPRLRIPCRLGAPLTMREVQLHTPGCARATRYNSWVLAMDHCHIGPTQNSARVVATYSLSHRGHIPNRATPGITSQSACSFCKELREKTAVFMAKKCLRLRVPPFQSPPPYAQ